MGGKFACVCLALGFHHVTSGAHFICRKFPYFIHFCDNFSHIHIHSPSHFWEMYTQTDRHRDDRSGTSCSVKSNGPNIRSGSFEYVFPILHIYKKLTLTIFPIPSFLVQSKMPYTPQNPKKTHKQIRTDTILWD